MNAKATAQTVEVTADDEGLISHAGAFLLTELADRLGLTKALSAAMAPTRERRSAHDPGRVLRDLVVSIADGGECVSDLGVLRGQQALFGAVASETTARRAVKSIDAAGLDRIRAARAPARARAWEAGARPDQITLDIDATLLDAHSEKESAAGTYKRGFGFHPLLCCCDESGEALAGVLRPGNAGSNTAADHFRVLELALEQLPEADLDREILARADSGGATHAFTADCHDAGIRFSVGYALDETVRSAILDLDESAWEAAIDAEGETREGAAVAELTGSLDLAAWPEGTRLICRRERPHPGAQFEVFDAAGYRHTCFLTDQPDPDIAALELRHRRRARVEDAIRPARTPGCETSPSPTSPQMRPGSSSRSLPRTCSPTRSCFASMASWRRPSPSDFASASFTSPGGSSAPLAAGPFACRAAGPGPRRWSRPSDGCARWSRPLLPERAPPRGGRTTRRRSRGTGCFCLPGFEPIYRQAELPERFRGTAAFSPPYLPRPAGRPLPGE